MRRPSVLQIPRRAGALTQKFHISYRLDNGAIVGIGGDNLAELSANLSQLFADAPQTVADLLAVVKQGLIEALPHVTTQQAVQNIQQAFPQAQVISSDDQWAGMPATQAAPPQQWQQPQQQQWPQQQGYPQQQQYPAQQQYQQPVQQQQRQPAGPPPGVYAPLCPMHGQPATWRDGSFGSFWGCSVKNGYKAGCKIPKEQQP